MLMRNPSGQLWHVTHPMRDESGGSLVGPGYWRGEATATHPWEVIDEGTGRVLAVSRHRWWARVIAFLLRGGVYERVEWDAVGSQRYEVTCYDPVEDVYLELPRDL